MRRGLTVDDLGDFLELPVVAVLATYRASGEVLLSPVWHRWRDGGFEVATTHDDVKVRHLAANPEATILVYEQTPPYRGIELRTRPAIVTDGAVEAAREIAVRYLGLEGGEAFAAASGDDTIIRLEPGTLRIWDFSDDY